MSKTRIVQSRDVVCGIRLQDGADHFEVTYRGKRRTFCSEACLARFRKTPERFLKTPLIQLKDVRKTFHTGDVETQVLRGLDLSIWKGDFVAIIGASGSGKSTALNMIGLLDRPTSGQVLLEGDDVSGFRETARAMLRSKTFGFIFQQYNLIPWLTAFENVTLPLVFAERDAKREFVEKEFAQFGMGHRMNHRPVELSGGEQQRTALMRALVTDPPIILGDEPTGNLDSVTGEKILDRLVDLHRREGRTLIVVSHDQGIADRADQIITIKDGIHVTKHTNGRLTRA